ncbi:Uncharacterized protein GmHk_07G019162 [Glycine max]|nr:Uncharacterized protein GmHk_07G019162 [Glycine max]
MDNPKQALGSFTVVTLLFAGVLLLYNWSSSFSNELVLSQKEPLCEQSNFTTTNVEAYGDGLDTALAKTSMENKTVIIAIVNKAYVEQDVESDTTMLDIFLGSFWLGEGTRSLIDHLLIVTVDRTAYDRCQFLRLNCFRLETDGVDFEGEKIYMSQDFIKMMWRRTRFLLEVLKRGYNFVFTDTDVMWLRNPFTRLSKNETEDFQISTDTYLGDPWSEKHLINTGFYFVRSNNKTISLFETWYGQKDNATGKKEQDVLLHLIRSGIIEHLGLRVRFLDTLYFSGFCQDSKDFRAVATIHANCCRSITAKVADMKVALRDWKKFKRLEANSTDTDVMWLRNSFIRLSKNETEDLQISTYAYLGDHWLEKHPINTGFYFVSSNNKTISLFETWYGQKDKASHRKKKSKDILFYLIKSGIIKHLGLRVRFLDTLYYFSGFCQNSKDVREVITVHANCCRSITAQSMSTILGKTFKNKVVSISHRQVRSPTQKPEPL